MMKKIKKKIQSFLFKLILPFEVQRLIWRSLHIARKFFAVNNQPVHWENTDKLIEDIKHLFDERVVKEKLNI